jgi:hypothetical protein
MKARPNTTACLKLAQDRDWAQLRADGHIAQRAGCRRSSPRRSACAAAPLSWSAGCPALRWR